MNEEMTQVRQCIPVYLSDAIESIQRGALRMIFPNSSYQQAIDQANLTSIANRRIFICKASMADMRNESHPISLLRLQVTTRSIYPIPVKIRKLNTKSTTTTKRTRRANDFFTFRFW